MLFLVISCICQISKRPRYTPEEMIPSWITEEALRTLHREIIKLNYNSTNLIAC
jgi:hypothetical protein